MTGFFLAGIYPVGMKIAADYFDKDLGKALGFLLGALVLGTAFPHLLKSLMDDFRWQDVVIAISVMAIIGGLLILLLVPDGPFRKAGGRFDKGVLFKIFRNKNLRAAAFGYFGHMWELYTFWTFVPVLVASLIYTSDVFPNDVSQFSFFIIGIGAIACIIGGMLSGKLGSFKVAFYALASSALCCIISPLIFTLNPAFIYVFFLFWGMVVIMDSPQFSSLIAQSAYAENKASALTIVNCIGFSITIISIQLINFLADYIDPQWLFVFLFPGPALGLYAMLKWEGPR
jgi:MFS family permease